VHGVARVGALGLGRAILICVALSSTEVAAVISSAPCFVSEVGCLDAINDFMALVWMGSGGRAWVLPLSGGKIHGSETSWCETGGDGGYDILSDCVLISFFLLHSGFYAVVQV